MPRLLVLEGNSLAGRRRWAEIAGLTPSESYADVLRALAPEAVVDIATPADADARLPQPIDAYHGIVITGSALNIYQREPEALRQIELVRTIFAQGVPMFGSCWGLQLATVAAGGEVSLNPAGREVGFARKIALTEAGRAHPMHAARSVVFDAPAIHSDIVTTLPPDGTVTACNAMSEVQAAEIRSGRGRFWGVQYHPEFSLQDVACVIRLIGQPLVDEGFFADLAELERYAADLATLHHDRARGDLLWRLGLDQDVADDALRQAEIGNWLASLDHRQAATSRTG
ncbi:type 1 glutamine amidotransferase [Bradyrhizobium sp. 83012]|uniref:Type 1 glutamine amidotransferase n=1 Tax=Bradyrhizobium aeschynomenes TaxID=2734909 RepID=A0ABX2CE89_9BRAD|nr:type 1 glutamine amidotransferase [Bradyrhizobium aeschynomenes]NPU13256.1 type 1 glutamine amidotransferase [Bradyrhizobium aeschynomenes]NPU66544.1 type 1 glutamine amidotransferase [Bradyrhizobium aeschynomenes]